MTSRMIPKENLKYELSSKDAFVDSIQLGEEVTVDCEIACNGELVASMDRTITLGDFKYPFFNPLVGPIEIKNAKAGQVLCVKIKAIDVNEIGFTGLMPHSGLFPDWIWDRKPEFTQFKRVRVADGKIQWDEKRSIPTAPMIGVIAVAPAFGSTLSVDLGEYGGNLDVQEIAPGATVYLPVNHDGGYLYVGDCHARQGDGEVAGFGAIDIGAKVTLSVDVKDRPKRMTWPRFENETHIGAIGCSRTLEDGMRVAYREIIYWLADEYGFTEAEAYLLLGTVAEGRATQIMNPKTTYICKVRKDLIK